MSQPPGFPQPIDALLAVATCLGGFTITNAAGDTLVTQFFIGDEGVGGVIDCCVDPILRIESVGELPASGTPIVLSKHGCIELTMGVKVTFLTCFRTISKSGVVLTDPADLAYSRVLQDARWRALEMLRCCRNPNLRFVSSAPVSTDGKCSGFQIDLLASLTMCEPCPPVPVSA